LPESFKVPFITYLIYFGVSGMVLLLFLYKSFYKVSMLRLLVLMLITSFLSSGGGFVFQCTLVMAFLLHNRIRIRLGPSFN